MALLYIPRTRLIWMDSPTSETAPAMAAELEDHHGGSVIVWNVAGSGELPYPPDAFGDGRVVALRYPGHLCPPLMMESRCDSNYFGIALYSLGSTPMHRLNESFYEPILSARRSVRINPRVASGGRRELRCSALPRTSTRDRAEDRPTSRPLGIEPKTAQPRGVRFGPT